MTTEEFKIEYEDYYGRSRTVSIEAHSEQEALAIFKRDYGGCLFLNFY